MRLATDALVSSRSFITHLYLNSRSIGSYSYSHLSNTSAVNRSRRATRRSSSLLRRTRNRQIRTYISASVLALSPDTSSEKWGPEKSIGIIGGGISGLATAYYIQERFKRTYFRTPKVTIYEKSEHLGGWIGSEKVSTANAGEYIRIEKGPRTLAASPAGMVTMDMIEQIGILSSVRWVKKDDPSAQNRYIYDGGDALKKVPTSMGAFFWDLCTVDSVMLPALKHCFLNFFRRIPQLGVSSDVSLGMAMSKIVGERTVQTLVSAFIHGIYAGNIWDLSTRAKGPWSTILTQLRHQPKSVQEMMFSKPDLDQQPFWIGEKPKWMKEFDESFVFYLKEGLELLPLAVESHLRMETKTEILLNSDISCISNNEDSSISVTGTKDGETFTHNHDYIVSALPPNKAHEILDPPPPWQDLQSVSVGTVTFFWPDKFPIPYSGFGYVISQATPMEQNPHGALGVIFDSSTRPSQDKAAGQKVTVLLGGEYWVPGLKKGVSLPTKEELITQAEETLQVQLGVTEKAEHISASVMAECIPQPSVAFMKSTHTKSNPSVKFWAEKWNNKLLLAGPPVFGPGVHDCINGAYTTVSQILMTETSNLASAHAAGQLSEEDTRFFERLAKGEPELPLSTDMGDILWQARHERGIKMKAQDDGVSEEHLTGGKDALWPIAWNRQAVGFLKRITISAELERRKKLDSQNPSKSQSWPSELKNDEKEEEKK